MYTTSYWWAPPFKEASVVGPSSSLSIPWLISLPLNESEFVLWAFQTRSWAAAFTFIGLMGHWIFRWFLMRTPFYQQPPWERPLTGITRKAGGSTSQGPIDLTASMTPGIANETTKQGPGHTIFVGEDPSNQSRTPPAQLMTWVHHFLNAASSIGSGALATHVTTCSSLMHSPLIHPSNKPKNPGETRH
jgi:hypothetical protein